MLRTCSPRQTRLEMQKALEEDSSVYEYDSVYDDIQKKRLETNKKLLGGTDRKVSLIRTPRSVSNVYSRNVNAV